QALFVVNLDPKRMAGEVSQGMLFDIGFADGLRPVLAVPEQAVSNGSPSWLTPERRRAVGGSRSGLPDAQARAEGGPRINSRRS
ncbi:MAG TPA: hypothetical protein VMR21_07830, partial [Vicinamibacteria bacterium]|nr:hypothetical protein [Vicinamibacteria bacterium]